MAIALRGDVQEGNANNGNDVTLTFDTVTPPLEDDIVVVFGGHGIATTTLADPSGYTLINKHETTAPIFGMWFKKMTSTPDLSVVCSGGGNNLDGVAYCCWVLSGVDTTNAEDATATTTGPTTSTNPDPASITTVTNNAWVMPCTGATVNDTTPGTISGYTDHINRSRNETNPFSCAGARIEKVLFGAEDPDAWSSYASSTWYAITAAFRPAPAGGDITEEPGVGSLSLTGQVPILATGVQLPAGSLSLTGFAPSVSIGITIAVPTGSLTLTGFAPTVEISRVAVPDTGTLVLTGLAATVEITHIRDPPLASLTLTGFAPTVNITQSIPIPAGSLTLTGQAPTAIQTFSIDIPVGSGVFTGFVPTVVQTFSIDVPVGSLILTGLIPTVSITQSIPVPAGSLNLTGFAPTVIQTFSIDVPVGSLTLTGSVPTLAITQTISVPVGSLTLTGLLPTVERSFFVAPGVGSLTLTGEIPTVIDSGAAGETVTPDVGSLTLTGFIPTVVQTFSVEPGVGILTITGLVPGITVTLPPPFGELFHKVTLTGEIDFTQFHLLKEDGFNLLKEDGGLLLIRSDAILARTDDNTYTYATTLMENTSFKTVIMTRDLFTSVRIP